MLSLVLFIIILGTIVLIHELGHFLFAKLFGVYVYEYSIGMGKKIWSKKPKNSETEYSIRLFPIGGFVRLAGEEGEDGARRRGGSAHGSRRGRRVSLRGAGRRGRVSRRFPAPL